MPQLSEILRAHAILTSWEDEKGWRGDADEWGEKWYYNPEYLALFRLECEFWEVSRAAAERLEAERSPFARIAWAISDHYLPM